MSLHGEIDLDEAVELSGQIQLVQSLSGQISFVQGFLGSITDATAFVYRFLLDDTPDRLIDDNSNHLMEQL